MSDPVKNEEIEDVLSSIRRLVSESGGTKSDVKAVAEQLMAAAEAPAKERLPDAKPVERPNHLEALVLTPSLRVSEQPDAPEDAPNTSEEAAEYEDEASDDAGEHQAGIEASEASEPEHASSEHEAQHDHSDTHDDHDTVHEDHHHDHEASATEPDDSDASESVVEEAVEEHDAQPEPEAHDEPEQHEPTAQQEMQGEGHDDASRDEDNGAPTSFLERIARLEEAVDATEHGEWEDEIEDQPSEALQWEDNTSEEAFSFVPAEEAQEAEFEELSQEEPVAAEETAQAAETDEAEASHDGASDALELSEQEEDFDFLAGGEDTIIDEEALREMVSEIVRQELQGALGERITRNVRKLVRREIHRALMAQELE